MGCPLTLRDTHQLRTFSFMTKYAKPREVANAHIQCIMALPVITGTKPTRINEFYEKLVTNVQTLESMGKEKDNRWYV